MSEALRGLRVLDLAGLPGAWCGRLLALHGADVTRIEPGDAALRRRAGFVGLERHVDADLARRHYDAGKKTAVIDLDSERGRAELLALAQEADLLLESFAPGTLASLGIGWDTLARAAPRLVLVSLSAFGQTGPRRHWRASDTVAQAAGGMLGVNGHPGEAPLRGLGLQAYHSGSTWAAIAALLALFARQRSGRGVHADVSLQAAVAAMVEHAAGQFHQTGAVEERRGSLHWTRTFRVGRCRDGHVLHTTLCDWSSLVAWVASEGMAEDLLDSAWEDFDHRKQNCEHLFDVLDRWAAGHTLEEIVEGAQLRRLPFAPVRPLAALAADEHLRARGFFVEGRHPECGRTALQPGGPFRLQAGGGETASAGATPQRAAAAPERPLAGVRVLDFTWVVAGPVATRILADQGAEVIKIERRDSLDFGSRRGGLSGNLNRGKQSVVVDMSRPEGLEVARALVTHADVVIDNFSARVLPNWDLDYDALRRLRPDVIAVSMSGFGRSGPRRDWVSYGPTLQALTGFTHAMRHPGGEPAGWGFSYADMVAGANAALAVLLALWQRRRTGAGQLVDFAQMESLAAVIGAPLLAALDGAEIPAAAGNLSPEGPAAPDGVYRCADERRDGHDRDRWCAVAVFGDDEWRRFAAAIGAPAWTRAPRFAAEDERLRHRQALDRKVEEWTRTRPAEEVQETLQAAGIAAALVADSLDLCSRDPQLRHRGYWVEVTAPEGGAVRLDGVPFRLGDLAGGPEAPGPLLGEHTDAVLRRVLGYDEGRIAALRAAGAVG